MHEGFREEKREGALGVVIGTGEGRYRDRIRSLFRKSFLFLHPSMQKKHKEGSNLER